LIQIDFEEAFNRRFCGFSQIEEVKNFIVFHLRKSAKSAVKKKKLRSSNG